MGGDEVLSAVLAAVDIVNEQLPSESKLERSPQARISGDGAGLDSMGLVSLILAAEEQLTAALGRPVQLAETLLADEQATFPETLADLVEFAKRLGDDVESATV